MTFSLELIIPHQVVDIFAFVGVSLPTEELQDILVYIHEETGPCPKAVVSWLLLSSPDCPPFLNVCTSLPSRNSGKFLEINSFTNKKWDRGFPCPGTPRIFAWFQSHDVSSISWSKQERQ